MTPREGFQVMALVDFEDIGFEQRVVRDAAKRHAVVCEDVRVELEVLPDLGRLDAFEPGTQDRERFFHSHLIRRASVAMRDRDIERDVVESEREPDEIGGHRLKAVGFGVEADQRGRLEAPHEIAQAGVVDDHRALALWRVLAGDRRHG